MNLNDPAPKILEPLPKLHLPSEGNSPNWPSRGSRWGMEIVSRERYIACVPVPKLEMAVWPHNIHEPANGFEIGEISILKVLSGGQFQRSLHWKKIKITNNGRDGGLDYFEVFQYFLCIRALILWPESARAYDSALAIVDLRNFKMTLRLAGPDASYLKCTTEKLSLEYTPLRSPVPKPRLNAEVKLSDLNWLDNPTEDQLIEYAVNQPRLFE